MEKGKKIEARSSVGGCHSCAAKSGRWPGLEGCCHSRLAEGLRMGEGEGDWFRQSIGCDRTFGEGEWALAMEVLGCQDLYLEVKEK